MRVGNAGYRKKSRSQQLSLQLVSVTDVFCRDV